MTADPLHMDAIQLQQEVLRLQTRIQKLIAVPRVLLVVLKISRFSLNQPRLPDGHDKRSLLRAIDRSRSALPLRSVLRVIRLSPSRYHNWSRHNSRREVQNVVTDCSALRHCTGRRRIRFSYRMTWRWS